MKSEVPQVRRERGRPKSNRKCSIEGCEVKHYGRSWCRNHYMSWYSHGDPLIAERGGRPHETQHGTVNEYGNYGCRCAECVAAMADHQQKVQTVPCPNCGQPMWARWRKTKLCRSCSDTARHTPLDLWHGTETGYHRGCRCDECRTAATTARRERRERNREADRSYHREKAKRPPE